MKNEASVQTYVGESSKKKYFFVYAVLGQNAGQAKTWEQGDILSIYYNKADAEKAADFARRTKADTTQRGGFLYDLYSKYVEVVVRMQIVWIEY